MHNLQYTLIILVFSPQTTLQLYCLLNSLDYLITNFLISSFHHFPSFPSGLITAYIFLNFLACLSCAVSFKRRIQFLKKMSCWMSVVLFCLFPFGFCLKKTILGTERKSRQLNSWFFQLYFEVGYLYKNQTPFINFWCMVLSESKTILFGISNSSNIQPAELFLYFKCSCWGRVGEGGEGSVLNIIKKAWDENLANFRA